MAPRKVKVVNEERDRSRALRTAVRMTALVASVGVASACAKSDINQAAPSASAAVAAAKVAPPAPSAAPEPSAGVAVEPEQSRTYAVFGVKPDDVLNVRAEPEASSKKVYSYGPDVTTIRSTGRLQLSKDGVPWVEVKFEGSTGWVNRMFLTEMQPGGGCDDPNLTAAIRKFMRAVAQSDGASLQEIVSPLRGLLVRQADVGPTVHFPANESGGIFTSPVVKRWGGQAGDALAGPFKTVILPNLREDVAGKGAQEKCGRLLPPGKASLAWPAEFAGFTLVSFHRPGAGRQPWHTSVAGLEYVDGKPYFAALVQFDGGVSSKSRTHAADSADDEMTEGMRMRNLMAEEAMAREGDETAAPKARRDHATVPNP